MKSFKCHPDILLLLLLNAVTEYDILRWLCLEQALDAAFAHYDNEQQKRTAKGGAMPNGFFK